MRSGFRKLKDMYQKNHSVRKKNPEVDQNEKESRGITGKWGFREVQVGSE